MLKSRFLIRLNKNRWFSENTIYQYWRYLEYFNSFLIKNRKRSLEECSKINQLDIDTFISKERTRRCIRSCNCEISAIKSYLKFCSIIWKNVMNTDSIIRTKEEDKKIECLKDSDSIKLLNYFKNIESNNNYERLLNKRNYCICWLLIYTWLRVSELCNLKRSQLSNSFSIIWKWWKLRLVNLFEEDFKVINEYLNLRKDDSDDLFICFDKHCFWEKLCVGSVQKIIKNWWKKAWLSERVRPHKLRHTFATNLLRNWVKLEHIQKLLGHSSLATTQIYLTIENNEVRQSQSKIKRF